MSIDEELGVGQINRRVGSYRCSAPFLLSKRVERVILREVRSIELHKRGIRDLWVEQLEFSPSVLRYKTKTI